MLIYGKTPLFDKYVAKDVAAIYPWSLSIVDCYFIYNAFKASAGSNSVCLIRLWDDDCNKELLTLSSAYDLYDADTKAYGSEVVILHPESNSRCYWDPQERFVLVLGSESFLSIARPYPVDIEEHRYAEEMDSSEELAHVYSSLRNR